MDVKKRCGRAKKGFAVQFNWLFVLIGGFVILGFFFALIQENTTKIDQGESEGALKQIEEAMKASLSTRDTQRIFIFDKELTFSCDPSSGYSEYNIKGAFKRRTGRCFKKSEKNKASQAHSLWPDFAE